MATIESTISEEKIQELPPGDRSTLLAVEGAPQHIQSQLARMPDGATHAVLSVGGDDALREIEVLDRPSHTVPMPSRKRKVRSSFDYLNPIQTRPLCPPCDKA
jgi:hypothetical protein